jgi:hypothetical protein
MDELKQLDAVLKVLANYNENRTYHFITIGLTKYLDKVPPEHRMKEILLYLEEKRYITITREYPTDKSMMKCTFSMTQQGRLFSLNGGFICEKVKRISSKTFHIITTILIVCGTVSAGYYAYKTYTQQAINKTMPK